MADIKILGIAGSLRKESFNRRALRAAQGLVPSGAALEIVDLPDLPGFNQDSEKSPPPAVTDLKTRIRAADAILIVTPEYNGSIPGVLKNAIDWLSRPYGAGALKDKPLAVIGAALGQYGGVWAHDETRKSFGIAGPRVVEDLELSLPAQTLDGKHPRENADVVAKLRDIVGKLVAEIG